MNLRHITRFTYEFTNFQGWRVAISRQGTTLARYFSDKQYGSEEEAGKQAILFRDKVLEEIKQHPEMTRDILYKYRIQNSKLSGKEKEESLPAAPAAADSGNPQNMLKNLKKLCRYLQLDTVGMLRLSMCLFILQHETADAAPKNTGLPTCAALKEMSRVVSDSQLQHIIELFENTPNFADVSLLSEASAESVAAQVPYEEISARESTPELSNTSPPEEEEKSAATVPCTESPALPETEVVQNMRPPLAPGTSICPFFHRYPPTPHHAELHSAFLLKHAPNRPSYRTPQTHPF